MKPVIVLVILAAAVCNCLGQHIGTPADENVKLFALALKKAEAACEFKVLSDFSLEQNLKSSMPVSDDCDRRPGRSLKLKITFSDSWFGRDKAHHFLTSAFLSAAGYYVLRDEQKLSNQKSRTGGFCFSLSIGLAKEFRDSLQQNNAASIKDLVANLLGIMSGILIISD